MDFGLDLPLFIYLFVRTGKWEPQYLKGFYNDPLIKLTKSLIPYYQLL